MLQFAYIINMPGYNPNTYADQYNNADSKSVIVGVDGIEGAKAYLQQLAEAGFTLVNLCSDFDDAAAEEIRKNADGSMKIRNANYFCEEGEKLAALEAPSEYGVIVVMNGVEESVKRYLASPECNTTVYFVKDLEAAKEAASALKGQGIHFIELCSWFDEEKTRAVIDSIGGSVPVGSCGI